MTAVLNTTKLVEIFIACDDFNKKMSQYLLAQNLPQNPPTHQMSESEMMAIDGIGA